MNTILKTLGGLLETMVREANTKAFEEYDRKLERLQELISDLKESVGMIQRQLRNAGVNLTPQPIIRTSPHDIRNFRKKLVITQEVFAQMLHVHRLTLIRWEKNLSTPHARHKRKIQSFKTMTKAQLHQAIQEAKTALYE